MGPKRKMGIIQIDRLAIHANNEDYMLSGVAPVVKLAGRHEGDDRVRPEQASMYGSQSPLAVFDPSQRSARRQTG
jgi:hypothetical protein